MRSKIWVAERRPVRQRFGTVLGVAMLVFAVEAVLAVIALGVRADVREHAGPLYVYDGVLSIIGMAVVGAVATCVVVCLGASLSVGVVMPVLHAADRLGRRFDRLRGWWLVPTLAAVVAALPAWAAGAAGGGRAAACTWLGATAALAAPALVAQRLLLPGRPYLSGGAMFRRVAAYGALSIAAAGVLGLGLSAGFGYEPPTLSARRAAGVWSDGEGGTLVLTADGTARATGVGPAQVGFAPACSGTGTWTYQRARQGWDQQVEVSIDGCSGTTWSVLGTRSRPKLYVFVGDPADQDLYALERHR